MIDKLPRWLRPRLDADDKIESQLEIDRLAGVGMAGIPLLLALLTPRAGRRPVAAGAAEKALDLLFQRLDPDELRRLDRRLRRIVVPDRAWQTLTPRQLEIAYGAETVPFSFCCLVTGHPDGQVREAAIRLVAADARALPFLLIRVNDWVDEVRSAARAALGAQVDVAPIEGWVGSLPLLLRLEKCGRDDHRELVSRVTTRLSAPEAEAALAAGLSSSRRAVRRAAFEVGAGRVRPSRDFLDAALAAGDSVVRLRAARLACERMSGEALFTLARQLDRDPLVAARMLALEIHRRQPAAVARARLLDGLVDLSASIRGACQYYLRRDFAVDCVEEYRRAIAAGPAPRQLAASLLGLAETGSAGDAAVALGQSSHSLTRVRVAAIRAVARLDPASGAQRLAEALADPTPRVARVARDILLGSRAPAQIPAIRAVFRAAPHLHSRRCALEALIRSGPWSYLGDLLLTNADPEPEIVERGSMALDRWQDHVNRCAVRPSASQLEAATAALDACAVHLDARIVDKLRFLLREAGGA